MSRFLVASLIVASALLGGCGGVTEYVADSSGKLHPVAHYRDAWEHVFQQNIEKEIRGDPVPPPFKTWRDYWQKGEYAALSKHPWGAKRIAQARALRKAHGLDPY